MRSGFFNSEIIGYDAENMPVFDRAEEASFFAKYFSQFISNGVFPNPSTNMQVLATTGMSVKVDVGVCYINGYMGWVEPAETFEIEESDTRGRIDRIVARLDFTDRSIKLAVKKGTVSGNPVAPELQRDYDIYEIGLADIKVNANVVEIKQENITDLRLNTELCGMVANHLQHLDTTTLFNQYQDWINRVTSEAEADLAELKQEFETTLQEEKQNFETALEGEREKFDTILNNLKNFYTEDFNTWFNNLKVVLSGNVAGNLQLEIENLQNDVNSKYDEINKKIDTLETKKEGKVYGVKRNIESSDPAWERIGHSVGLVANATHNGTEVQNDFDKIYPYSDIITYNYDTQAQRITAYYGEPTFKFDGSNGEVLTRIPEFWYKREQKLEEDGNTYEYVYIADYPAENFIKSEQFSVGRYIASADSNNQLHSLNGGSVYHDTIANLRNNAKEKGFCLMDWHYFIIQLLYLVEYANYDSQTMLGRGITSSSVINGQCDILGMKSGTPNDDMYTSMIYRGIEDIYGMVSILIDGINITSEGIFISYNSNMSESDNKLNDIFANNLRGYVKKIGYDKNNPIVQLPSEVGGSDSTYICDATAILSSEDMNRAICNNYINNIEMSGLWSLKSIEPVETTKPATRLILNK